MDVDAVMTDLRPVSQLRVKGRAFLRAALTRMAPFIGQTTTCKGGAKGHAGDAQRSSTSAAERSPYVCFYNTGVNHVPSEHVNLLSYLIPTVTHLGRVFHLVGPPPLPLNRTAFL